MSSTTDNINIDEHIKKVREERIAREKARIEKLRELNRKKYYKENPPKNVQAPVKNHVRFSKRPSTAPNLPSSSSIKSNLTGKVTNVKSVNENKKSQSTVESNESNNKMCQSTVRSDATVTSVSESNNNKSQSTVESNESNNKKSPSTVKSNESNIKYSQSTIKSNESNIKKWQSTVRSDTTDSVSESSIKKSQSTVESNESNIKKAQSTVMSAPTGTSVNENNIKKTQSTVRSDSTVVGDKKTAVAKTEFKKTFDNSQKSTESILKTEKSQLTDKNNKMVKLVKPKENKTSLLRLKKDGKDFMSQKHPNVTYRKSMAPKLETVKTEEIDGRILKEIKINNESKNTLTKLAVKNSMRKSMFVTASKTDKPTVSRKSMANLDTGKESVFDRLYKPKTDNKKAINNIEKLQTDSNYLKKVIKNSALIMKIDKPVRRSISAVHFKRISRNEMQNCIHKWASISDNLNKAHLTTEDDIIEEEKVTSAVKSEIKKVKFMTPMSNLMTPKSEELQTRLKNWLQKRGKALDSYHHLQCFGIHHLQKEAPKFELYDDDNKENIALESDSDDGSYKENMNNENDALSSGDKIDIDKWRRVSCVSESVDFNESNQLNETITSADTLIGSDDLVIGALNDLADLLKEGFDWEQSARWLRAIRSRFPAVCSSGAYWECRAALEERRGDLPASLHCWEEAIAKGTQQSVAEANLDQLLDKFMQLKISPTSGNQRPPNPKMVDVKNVFKSTIIRFAVQQAKLRESQTPIVTITPVRRSGRLSHVASHRVCESLRHAAALAPAHCFTPNRNLITSP